MRSLILLPLLLVLSACATKSNDVSGIPNWGAIGDDLNYKNSFLTEQKKVLSFHNESRWFNFAPDVHPYPKNVYELPPSFNGSKLSFSIYKDKKIAGLFVFELAIHNSEKDVFREVEMGRTNTLPFLFAIFSDQKAVKLKEVGLAKTKESSLMRISREDETKVWQIKVEAKSLIDALPDKGKQELTIFACFGERQHTPFQADVDRIVPKTPEIKINNKSIKPIKLIRSNPVLLEWKGDEWGKITELE